MGMYVCDDCSKEHEYLEMTNITHGAICEICEKRGIATFTWDLDRFPEEGVTIDMQLKAVKADKESRRKKDESDNK